MEKIQNQKHNIETFHYSIARMLERGSYYGLRSLVVLYMMGETLQMERSEALEIFGWVASSLIFSQIIGAVFGDLFIGNKKSIFAGGIMQAIGAFTLCFDTTYGLYIGLFFIVLGSGFYTPNIISNFGKTYLNKTKLLDAGFTIFYLAVNVGSFLGVLFIANLGEKHGYQTAFFACGLLTLFSLIPILKTNEAKIIEHPILPQIKRMSNIIIALILVAIFWGIYETAISKIDDIQPLLSEVFKIDIPIVTWQSLSAVLIFPVSLIAIVSWTNFYSSQFLKLLLGFFFGTIGFGIISLIPEVVTEKHTLYLLASMLFFAIAEVHIAPIIHSVLTKNANPKYLAILISLAFIPAKLIALIFGLFQDKLYENPTLDFKFAAIAMLLISIGIFIFLIKNKKQNNETTY